MKRLFTILVVVQLAATMWAQSPEKMSYQAVIRNSGGTLVKSTQIGMEINIRQGSPTGTVVYTETQMPTTNSNGLISIEIGGGTGFNTINWASDNFYIETKTAVEAPLTTYTITGVSQLLSVPYALHAKTAETVISSITETDPIYSNSQAANITSGDITKLSNLSGTNTGDQNLSSILVMGTNASNKKIVNVNQLGIGTASPNSSAALEINSTTQGFLMSRVTNIQRDAIVNPVQGLLIFNTSENTIQIFDGTIWQNLSMSLCTIPTAPVTINGDPRVDKNSSGVEYSISEVPNASSYYWTIPSDATITSGQGTKNIFVNFGTQGGNVSVQSVSGCGKSIFTNKEVFVGTLQIGDSFAGGIVFYIDGSGNHGLVCASIDLGRDAVPWGCQGTTISGADGTSIGTGSQNTTDIINGCTTVGIAAKICRNYSGGNYNDWFLPSKDELNLIYLNIPNKYILNFDDTYYYWSSSESSSTNAWNQKIINGSQYNDPKSTTGYSAVRPIRVF